MGTGVGTGVGMGVGMGVLEASLPPRDRDVPCIMVHCHMRQVREKNRVAITIWAVVRIQTWFRKVCS